jgi:hypothetical protein
MRIAERNGTANPAGSPKFIEVTSTRGQTPAERFESLATRLVRVPKKEVDEQARKRKRD